MMNIAVFASGSGTNAENMMTRFRSSDTARVALVLSDHTDAFVLTRAARFGVPAATFSAKEFRQDIWSGTGTVSGLFTSGEAIPKTLSGLLERFDIHIIVLAGFLLKVPPYLLDRYPRRVLNIHPALLPAYGGKGMHGMHVHEAVITAGEKESGITIHLCDEQYDHGTILHQSRCTITPEDTPESLAAKIHLLERVYPLIVEKYILDMNCHRDSIHVSGCPAPEPETL